MSMTPQEKAVSLVDWFMPMFSTYKMPLEYAKKCAVKVCNEIIDSHYGNPIEEDYQLKVIEQIKAIH